MNAYATDGLVESIIPYDRLTHINKDSCSDVDEFHHNDLTEVYNGILTVQAKMHLATDQADGIMFWRLDHDARDELSLPSAIRQTSQSH